MRPLARSIEVIAMAALLRPCLTLLALALLGAGCLDDYGETPFSCIKSPACPEGYRCVNQVCLREGAPPPWTRDARADKPSTPPVPDVVRSDSFKPADLVPREGVATFPDLPGGLTCKQINDCYGTCAKNNQACFETCFNKGSPDGRAKMDALEKCDQLAWNGTCYNACNYGSQSTCDACIDTACAKQIAACFP